MTADPDADALKAAAEVERLQTQIRVIRDLAEGASAGNLATTPRGRFAAAILSQTDPPAVGAASEFPATWAGGHALIIEFGDEELTARCQCGTPIGEAGTPMTSLETFAQPWETHAMTASR